MNYLCLVVGLTFFIVVNVFVPATGSGCMPPDVCPAVLYPDSCRAASFMVYDNQVCTTCDKCITETDWSMTPDGGCPTRPCPAVAYPEGCGARAYFIWNGQVCEDCVRGLC